MLSGVVGSDLDRACVSAAERGLDRPTDDHVENRSFDSRRDRLLSAKRSGHGPEDVGKRVAKSRVYQGSGRRFFYSPRA